MLACTRACKQAARHGNVCVRASTCACMQARGLPYRCMHAHTLSSPIHTYTLAHSLTYRRVLLAAQIDIVVGHLRICFTNRAIRKGNAALGEMIREQVCESLASVIEIYVCPWEVVETGCHLVDTV